MKQTELDWSRAWTLLVGKQVRAIRSTKGLSAQDLSDKCAVIGFTVARNTISNLENGRKEVVTIQEIVVMAFALGCPPVALLYPLEAEEVEMLPSLEKVPFYAAQWFSGHWHGSSDDDGWGMTLTERTDESALVLGLLREYVELQAQRRRLLKVLPAAPQDSWKYLSESLKHAEAQIEKLNKILPDQYGVKAPTSELWQDA